MCIPRAFVTVQEIIKFWVNSKTFKIISSVGLLVSGISLLLLSQDNSINKLSRGMQSYCSAHGGGALSLFISALKANRLELAL